MVFETEIGAILSDLILIDPEKISKIWTYGTVYFSGYWVDNSSIRWWWWTIKRIIKSPSNTQEHNGNCQKLMYSMKAAGFLVKRIQIVIFSKFSWLELDWHSSADTGPWRAVAVNCSSEQKLYTRSRSGIDSQHLMSQSNLTVVRPKRFIISKCTKVTTIEKQP